MYANPIYTQAHFKLCLMAHFMDAFGREHSTMIIITRRGDRGALHRRWRCAASANDGIKINIYFITVADGGGVTGASLVCPQTNASAYGGLWRKIPGGKRCMDWARVLIWIKRLSCSIIWILIHLNGLRHDRIKYMRH